MKNLVLKYGLISGAISTAIMLYTAFLCHNGNMAQGGELLGYAGMIVSMLFVFIGVRTYREQQSGGTITFWEAFKIGGMIALISCVCYVITWMFVYQFIMPDFLEKYIETYMQQMQNSGKSAEEIQKLSDEMVQYKEWYKNPLYRAGLTFMEPLPVAALATVVSAVILRKKED